MPKNGYMTQDGTYYASDSPIHGNDLQVPLKPESDGTTSYWWDRNSQAWAVDSRTRPRQSSEDFADNVIPRVQPQPQQQQPSSHPYYQPDARNGPLYGGYPQQHPHDYPMPPPPNMAPPNHSQTQTQTQNHNHNQSHQVSNGGVGEGTATKPNAGWFSISAKDLVPIFFSSVGIMLSGFSAYLSITSKIITMEKEIEFLKRDYVSVSDKSDSISKQQESIRLQLSELAGSISRANSNSNGRN